tara:strand:+ start:596 stop:994 length:399 start_codon:yes stop_codon:yes gene_type:complete
LPAAYLIFLGIRLFRAKTEPGGTGLVLAMKSRGRAFWESVTVEVLNPKTAIFYVAFLPQFTDPAAAFPIWLQFLILGTIVNSIFSCADLLCVLLAGQVAAAMRRSRSASRLVQRLGGGILVALGLNLAFSRH